MFLYQTINDHVRILTSRGYGGVVRVPEKIGNLPVTSWRSMHSPTAREEMRCSLIWEMAFKCAMKREIPLPMRKRICRQK